LLTKSRLEFAVDRLIDKSDQAIPIFGTDNRTTHFNLGLSRILPSGTRASLTWQNRRESTDSAFATLNPFYESIVALSIEQPLLNNFFGRQDRGEVSLARKRLAATAAFSQRTIVESIYRVLVDYWHWITQQKIVHITRRSLQEARRLEKLADQKKSLGLYESTDVLAAKANRLQIENQLVTAEKEKDNSLGRLRRGLDLHRDDVIVSHETFPFEQESSDPEEMLATALENRADYRAIRSRVEEKELALALAKNRKWPELDLVASLQLNGVDGSYKSSLSEIGGGDHPAVLFGATFEWPLENRLARSEAQRATWEKMKALFELKEMENRVTQEVEEMWREVEAWYKQVRINRRIERLQRKKWRQELKKYRQGRSSSDLVIRYQEDYLTAQRVTFNALFRYRSAILGLRLATNTLIP